MSRKPVSEQNKIIARYVTGAFGGTPHVREFVHDTEPLTIDILWCDDRPVERATSYSTIGLSGYPMRSNGDEYPTRLEIAGACGSDAKKFPNVLSTAAFIVMRSGRLFSPGAVIPDCVSEYYQESTVPHLYFTSPFLWEDSLKTMELSSRKVSWLLAMPISQAEYDFLHERGDEELEKEFVKRQIDIYDLGRPSAV